MTADCLASKEAFVGGSPLDCNPFQVWDWRQASPSVRELVEYSTHLRHLLASIVSVAMLAEREGSDSKCPADARDCSTTAERSETVALVALPVTLLVSDSSAMDEATFVSDSFVVIAEGMALDTEDCFRVAVWQVLVLSWVNRLELVVELQPVLLPFDSHSLATCRVPFDEASERDCDFGESDDSLDSFAALPSTLGVGLHSTSDASPKEYVDFVVPSEIVAGIVFAVELHATILERVVGPLDSSMDAEADAIAVAVDDFEVLASNEIVGSAECQEAANRPDLDSASVRNSIDPIPYDCSLDVVPTKILSSDVALRNRCKAEERELVVVASGTSDVHFVDSAEIFSVGPAVDAVIEEPIRSLVAVSSHSSCSVATCTPLAFVLDLADIQSCVDDN